MKGYVDDIEKATKSNNDIRRVLYTGAHLQLVLMTLQPGEAIGEETHGDRDQFFRIENGEGQILIDGSRHRIEDDFAATVPAGARHNVINTGDQPLKLYTLYGRPEHRDGVVRRTRLRPRPNTSTSTGKRRNSLPPSGPCRGRGPLPSLSAARARLQP